MKLLIIEIRLEYSSLFFDITWLGGDSYVND